jgi:hypothetical protein
MGTYQVWVKLPGGGVEHTHLREDEWMTLQVDCAEADAAIEDAGWCGTFGQLSGNRVVLQAIEDWRLREDAARYLESEA